MAIVWVHVVHHVLKPRTLLIGQLTFLMRSTVQCHSHLRLSANVQHVVSGFDRLTHISLADQQATGHVDSNPTYCSALFEDIMT